MTVRNRAISLLKKLIRTEQKNDTFCILPWIHVDCLADSAVARICCSSYPIEQNSVPLSYYHYSVDEIINSDYMRNVRRRMINGEKVAACNICYINESNQVNSRRKMQNSKWKNYPEIEFDKIIHDTVKNDYKINVKPYFIQLNLGNLCNLKCRMCHAGNSTIISKDPIQSYWSPPRYHHNRLYWQNNKISLLPDPFIGCEYEGLTGMVFKNQKGFVTVEKVGNVSIQVFDDTPLNKLTINLFSQQEMNKVILFCNGKALDELTIPAKNEQALEYDLSMFSGEGKIEISIEVPGDNHPGELEIHSLEIYKSDEERSSEEEEIVFCRTGSKKPWYLQENLLFGDFLKEISHVKEILFTGGEPLINPVMEKIIDFIIAEGKEKDIALALNTNTTYLPQAILKKLFKFDTMHMNLSIDAVGDVYEYIRYPAKWEKIKNNINILKENNIKMVAVPILQAYNVLNAVDLCRFFEESGVHYSLIMMHGPYFLHCALLPDPIRKIAADRLRDYAKNEAPQAKKDNLMKVAHSIEKIEIKVNKQHALEHFMLFTNDMDKVNSQNIRESIPELIDLLRKNCIEWNDNTRFA